LFPDGSSHIQPPLALVFIELKFVPVEGGVIGSRFRDPGRNNPIEHGLDGNPEVFRERAEIDAMGIALLPRRNLPAEANSGFDGEIVGWRGGFGAVRRLVLPERRGLRPA